MIIKIYCVVAEVDVPILSKMQKSLLEKAYGIAIQYKAQGCLKLSNIYRIFLHYETPHFLNLRSSNVIRQIKLFIIHYIYPYFRDSEEGETKKSLYLQQTLKL